MALTSQRWVIAAAILDALRLRLGGEVTIEAGWPGDQVDAEVVFLSELAGNEQIPVMTAGRKQRDDNFTLTFELKAGAPAQTLDEAGARITALVAALEDVLAQDPTLGALDSVVEAEITEWRSTMGRLPDGVVAWAQVTVSVHARYL